MGLRAVYDRFLQSLKKMFFLIMLLQKETLANIAEAQDRYKSEQGVFLKDLQETILTCSWVSGYKIPVSRFLKLMPVLANGLLRLNMYQVLIL